MRERTNTVRSMEEPFNTLEMSLSQPPGTFRSGSKATRRVRNPSSLPPVVSTPLSEGFWSGSPLNHSMVPSKSLVLMVEIGRTFSSGSR